MIEWLSQWAEAVIISVIIGTIIEMILPEGNSKKYIKVVIGVYILFTIISPVISKVTGKSIEVSDIIDLQEYVEEAKKKEIIQNSLQEDSATSVKKIYETNLKQDIQAKLQAKGYKVTDILLDVGNDANYTLNEIVVYIVKEEKEENINNEIETINEISVQIENKENVASKKTQLSDNEKNKIKEYLSGVYEISTQNIVIE